MSNEELIEMLIRLERHRISIGTPAPVGADSVMRPFYINLDAPESIRRAHGAIADFIGLTADVYVVRVQLREGVVGVIHRGHRDGLGEFIEIDEKLPHVPFAATLCHELCHKWLETNIGWNDASNEELTDVATVYLGLGKIMLNGSHYEETDAGGETTRTYKSGYITYDQFAFLYGAVCEMRDVPAAERSSLLHGFARKAFLRSGSVWSDGRTEARSFLAGLRGVAVNLDLLANYVDVHRAKVRRAVLQLHDKMMWDSPGEAEHGTRALEVLVGLTESRSPNPHVEMVAAMEEALSNAVYKLLQAEGGVAAFQRYGVVSCLSCRRQLRLKGTGLERCPKCKLVMMYRRREADGPGSRDAWAKWWRDALRYCRSIIGTGARD